MVYGSFYAQLTYFATDNKDMRPIRIRVDSRSPRQRLGLWLVAVSGVALVLAVMMFVFRYHRTVDVKALSSSPDVLAKNDPENASEAAKKNQLRQNTREANAGYNRGSHTTDATVADAESRAPTGFRGSVVGEQALKTSKRNRLLKDLQEYMKNTGYLNIE